MVCYTAFNNYLLTIKMPDIFSYFRRKPAAPSYPASTYENAQLIILFQMTGMNTASRLCPYLQIHHLFRTKYFTKVCIK